MKSGSLTVKQRSPDIQEEPHQEDIELHELEEVVKDFMQALSANDTKRMASIVRMAHDILHDYMDAGNRDDNEQEEQD